MHPEMFTPENSAFIMFMEAVKYFLMFATLVFATRGIYLIYAAQDPKSKVRTSTGFALVGMAVLIQFISFSAEIMLI
jgi:hypothetical protein